MLADFAERSFDNLSRRTSSHLDFATTSGGERSASVALNRRLLALLCLQGDMQVRVCRE